MSDIKCALLEYDITFKQAHDFSLKGWWDFFSLLYLILITSSFTNHKTTIQKIYCSNFDIILIFQRFLMTDRKFKRFLMRFTLIKILYYMNETLFEKL